MLYEVITVHHAHDHDERGDAQTDAAHGEETDEGNEGLPPEREEVAQGDKQLQAGGFHDVAPQKRRKPL